MRKWAVLLVFIILCQAVAYPAVAESPTAIISGDYEYVLREDGSACLTLYKGHAKALTIPGDMDGHPVKAVGKDAFPKGLSVSSILIPAGIREIGAGAFRFLDKLAAIGVINVNPVYASAQGVLFDKKQNLLHTYPRSRGGALYGIPRGIETIGESAFYQPLYLESVYIPSSVSLIGDQAFYGCKKFFAVRLPESIQTIGGKAFAGCTGLTYMEVPKSVTNIGPGVFLRCESLEELLVDEENPTYAAINGVLVEKETKLLHTYLQKKASQIVRIPGGITAVGELAFSDCLVLREVTVPDSVKAIGREAFARCYNLESITLPGGDLAIEPGAFLDSMRLNMKVKESSPAHAYAVENTLPFTLNGK